MALSSRKASMGRRRHIAGKAAANDNVENTEGDSSLKMKIVKFLENLLAIWLLERAQLPPRRVDREREARGRVRACPAPPRSRRSAGPRGRPGIPRHLPHLVWLVWGAASTSRFPERLILKTTHEKSTQRASSRPSERLSFFLTALQRCAFRNLCLLSAARRAEAGKAAQRSAPPRPAPWPTQLSGARGPADEEVAAA